MSQKSNKEQLDILYLQIILSIIFLSNICFSIFSTYNEIYNIKYGRRIVSSKEIKKLTKFNRVIALIVLFGFLYINYRTKEIDQKEFKNTTPDDLAIMASYFSIIAGIITLYIVFNYGEESIISGENPGT